MPTYVYHCDTCNTNFEKFQKFSEDPLRECPQGHDGVRRVITPSAIIFKGSGWYITDSKSGGNGTSATTSTSTDSGTVKPADNATNPLPKSEGTNDANDAKRDSVDKKEAKPESKSSTEAA